MASPIVATPPPENQPLLSDPDDSSGDGRHRRNIQYLPPKGRREELTSMVSRRGAGVSGFIDVVGTITSALVNMASRSSSAGADLSQLLGKDVQSTTDASNFINNDLAPKFTLVGGWGFFFSNLFYGLRILLTGQGKQNRAGKIAFAFIGICGLIAAMTIMAIVGMTIAAAATALFLTIPFLAIALNSGIIARWGVRLSRTRAALHPEALYKQKKEKHQLARDEINKLLSDEKIKKILTTEGAGEIIRKSKLNSNDLEKIIAILKKKNVSSSSLATLQAMKARFDRFKIEKEVLKWTLKKAFSIKQVKKEQFDQLPDFKRLKKNAELLKKAKELDPSINVSSKKELSEKESPQEAFQKKLLDKENNDLLIQLRALFYPGGIPLSSKAIKEKLLPLNALPLSEAELYRQIAIYFTNYQDFLDHLKLSSDENEKARRASELAFARAAQMHIDQEEKYKNRKKFYIVGTILSSTFIANSVLGFMITGATASTPLFALSAAALVGLKLASAALGFSVLACMAFFAITTMQGAISEYKQWIKDHQEQLAGPRAEDWNNLHKGQTSAMALRVSGTALLLVTSLLLTTLFLPFVFPLLAPAVLAGLAVVGAVLLATSTILMVIGSRKAGELRQKESDLQEKEFKASLTVDLGEDEAEVPPVSPGLSLTGSPQPTQPSSPGHEGVISFDNPLYPRTPRIMDTAPHPLKIERRCGCGMVP